VHSKEKPNPLSDAHLEVFESGRDLAADLLESVQEMTAGKGEAIYPPSINVHAITDKNRS